MHEGPAQEGTGQVFLDLWQTCSMACMWAWANLQNRPRKRLSGLREALQTNVSFAKARILMGKGVAHALDYDFRLVHTGCETGRLEGRLRRTLTVQHWM